MDKTERGAKMRLVSDKKWRVPFMVREPHHERVFLNPLALSASKGLK